MTDATIEMTTLKPTTINRVGDEPNIRPKMSALTRLATMIEARANRSRGTARQPSSNVDRPARARIIGRPFHSERLITSAVTCTNTTPDSAVNCQRPAATLQATVPTNSVNPSNTRRGLAPLIRSRGWSGSSRGCIGRLDPPNGAPIVSEGAARAQSGSGSGVGSVPVRHWRWRAA